MGEKVKEVRSGGLDGCARLLSLGEEIWNFMCKSGEMDVGR